MPRSPTTKPRQGKEKNPLKVIWEQRYPGDRLQDLAARPYLLCASSLPPRGTAWPRRSPPLWGLVPRPRPRSSRAPGIPGQPRRGTPGTGAAPSARTWGAPAGTEPPPHTRGHLPAGARPQHRAEGAPKRRQAFIAGHSLPGTAIFTVARSSGLFVMLKRLIGGVGTEQGGGKAAHGIRAEICPL